MSNTTTENEDYIFDNAVIGYEVKTVITHTQKTVASTLPKLPYDTWQQVVSFMKHIAKSQDTEAIVSLTIVDGEWKVICWNQEPSGPLHVKFQEGSEENQALLTEKEKDALLKVHCTVHSHNKSNAFQSSDDADDELGKEGWHITVGNCDKEVISTHCRLNCKRLAEFDEKGKKTAGGWQVFAACPVATVVESPQVPKKYRKFMKDNRVLLTINASVAYPEEWNERAKKKVPTYPQTHRGNFPTTNRTTTTGTTTTTYREQMEIVTSIIDTRFPFEGPARLNEPEWVLAQALWTEYTGSDMIKDVEHCDYSVGNDLERKIQAALDNTETYFIVEAGKDPEMVGISLPTETDIIDFLHDELPAAKRRTPAGMIPRLKDKVLLKALYKNFKTQSIFGAMSI